MQLRRQGGEDSRREGRWRIGGRDSDAVAARPFFVGGSATTVRALARAFAGAFPLTAVTCAVPFFPMGPTDFLGGFVFGGFLSHHCRPRHNSYNRRSGVWLIEGVRP